MCSSDLEHHGSRSFAGCAPEILIPRLAAETARIRVGSGGVMLPHYSPYKVAENFKLLDAMFPGRIDLGIGRAPGSDMVTAQALAYGSQIGIEYFHNKLADLRAFLTETTPMTRGLEKVWAAPHTAHVPELWLLGSSQQSAIFAAHFGLPYSFAHFIAPDQSQLCIDHYRENFVPNEFNKEPIVNLATFVLCTESEEKAEALARCRDLWRLRFEKGDPGPCPSIEEAAAYELTGEERARLDGRRKHLFAGTPETLQPRLEELIDAHEADELTVVTICHDFEDRLKSYELLADLFELRNGQST